MNFDTVASSIEAGEFAARINILSGSRERIQAATAQSEVIELKQLLEQQDNRDALVSRVIDIAAEDIDLRFEHPRDLPLAVYLSLLSSVDKELARVAASSVLTAQNLFLAKKISESILAQTEIGSDTPYEIDQIELPRAKAWTATTDNDLRAIQNRAYCLITWNAVLPAHFRKTSSIKLSSADNRTLPWNYEPNSIAPQLFKMTDTDTVEKRVNYD